jgi:hypothetical protein
METITENREFYTLHSSSKRIKMVKSMRNTWAVQARHVGLTDVDMQF